MTGMSRRKVLGVAAALMALAMTLSTIIAPAVAQQSKAPEKPVSSSLADACFAPYGLTYAKKVAVCTEAIRSGTLKGVQLGLGYYNRATAHAQMGEQEDATADYKEALRAFTDVIRVSQASAPLLFQRGLIYHTLGDADQAIVDYSDA